MAHAYMHTISPFALDLTRLHERNEAPIAKDEWHSRMGWDGERRCIKVCFVQERTNEHPLHKSGRLARCNDNDAPSRLTGLDRGNSQERCRAACGLQAALGPTLEICLDAWARFDALLEGGEVRER